ncbi:Flp pilus assembly protein CpaB [Shewanella psychropiezotolerans]|uniref:Flp pilus assembly protein CpaB n=1 Tax=Shewanella psychropiezotolerans TaxID=2593655 RepID=A0ABX5WXZ1_9GAMM|nr:MULTISPECIES: Flp pilus assembly protein CpaB [Shewanella]MPY24606.1 Flp pilus assembly protein CpaB [Shewanella sp. YLB-07]QDO83969.1 Flp pilus assembly protein CpaB [Shewanella psychropiezotolerans]
MNNKTILFVILSLVFGVTAVFLAQSWLKSNTEANLPQASTNVITMATVVPLGAILERKHLKQTAMPNSIIPETAVTTFEAAEGMVVKQNLYVGEILRSERLTKKGEGSTLASLISPQMRAVTIRVNDVVGVAGFLLPGNRVDVLNLFKRHGRLQTDVVLANVKILAIDQRSSNDENKPKLVRAVTLELSLEEAEILMIAKGRGKLQLALRNPNDSAVVELALINENKEVQPISNIVKPSKETVYVSSESKVKVYLLKGMKEQVIKVSN